MSVFDNKIFNGEVFQGYVDRIPNPKRSELIKSKALRQRPDLAQAMADQDGGNYLITSLKGLISNSVPQNYDGQTNIVAGATKTFKHGRVVVGRSNAWTEKDFSYDVTGGQDFIENIAEQISEYWGEVDQDTIVSILKGIFKMTGGANATFVSEHTTNVVAVTNSENKVGYMDGTTLNTAMQKACGDNKGKFSVAIMHSTVATNLENLKLLGYLKYTDAAGLERDLGIATLNGRLVLVDDTMPATDIEAVQAVQAVSEVKGTYTITFVNPLVAGDVITIGFGGASVVYTADGAATAAAAATTIKGMLAANSVFAAAFTFGVSNGVITLTEKVGGSTVIPTAAIVTSTTPSTPTVTAAAGTTGVAAVAAVASASGRKEYTTFILGDGAIEYTDCGAKVPYEVDRDPATNGGQDTLYSRQRKCFAPYGISFTQASMASLSPTAAELETGANWELVSAGSGESVEYISHKTIPIARIISLG